MIEVERVRLDVKVCVSVDVDSGILTVVLFIFYTSELFLTVGNQMVG